MGAVARRIHAAAAAADKKRLKFAACGIEAKGTKKNS
jgi:hypothetical protein